MTYNGDYNSQIFDNQTVKKMKKAIQLTIFCFCLWGCTSKNAAPCYLGTFIEEKQKCSSGFVTQADILFGERVANVTVPVCDDLSFYTTFAYEVSGNTITVTNIVKVMFGDKEVSPVIFTSRRSPVPGMANSVPFSFQFDCTDNGIKFTNAPFDNTNKVWIRKK